jgi:hypothetical protein
MPREILLIICHYDFAIMIFVSDDLGHALYGCGGGEAAAQNGVSSTHGAGLAGHSPRHDFIRDIPAGSAP